MITLLKQHSQLRISNVAHDDMSKHEYTMRLEVKGDTVATYVDKKKIDERKFTSYGKMVGVRADQKEQASISSFKIESIDGKTSYYNDNFTGTSNFYNTKIKNSKLAVDGTQGIDMGMLTVPSKVTLYECAIPVNVQFTPYLKINSDAAGKQINIYTDHASVGGVQSI
ncbi:MAG: hypothetical protein ACK5LL_16560 [Suipraeoptans sp.]